MFHIDGPVWSLLKLDLIPSLHSVNASTLKLPLMTHLCTKHVIDLHDLYLRGNGWEGMHRPLRHSQSRKPQKDNQKGGRNDFGHTVFSLEKCVIFV